MSQTDTVVGYTSDRPANAAQYARAIDQSAAGTVHDLGNLIQVASSGLNLLARDPAVASAPALGHIIVSVRTALERAGALARRTIAGGQRGHRGVEYVNIGSCLLDVVMIVGTAWEPGIRLEVNVGADLPVARCDHLGLQNAVLNLVFNARDAMPDGGLIAIEATASGQGLSARIELKVRDRGIGMTPQTAIRAFDPFFTTKSKGLGGIGLPTVKRFVEEAGGSVDIQSRLGSGTTVTLRLPAAL